MAPRGKNKRTIHLVVWLLVILCGLYVAQMAWMASRPVRKQAFPATCGSNLTGLGKALLLYAADSNDNLPTGDRWCDLLVKHAFVPPQVFICPHSGLSDGQCSYAMNAKVAGRKADGLPPDVVLLFESKPGWNQVGGPELLSTQNHADGTCGVLFGDKRVEFIKRDQLAKLRWDPN